MQLKVTFANEIRVAIVILSYARSFKNIFSTYYNISQICIL